MPIKNELLEILCCPVSKTPVKLLEEEQIGKLNERITQKQVRYFDGTLVEKQFKDGLITIDNKTIYEIDDGIPIMLAEKGIQADQVPLS